MGGLLGTLNKFVGFGDPKKVSAQGQDPNINNQMNALRELIYGQQGKSDRYYDAARNQMSADAFNDAQSSGQAFMRAMNSRGLMNSGMTGGGMSEIYSQAAQNLARNQSNLEREKIADKQQLDAQKLQQLYALLGMQSQMDQYNRGLQFNADQYNSQASQNSLMNFANMLGQAGGGFGAWYQQKQGGTPQIDSILKKLGGG